VKVPPELSADRHAVTEGLLKGQVLNLAYSPVNAEAELAGTSITAATAAARNSLFISVLSTGFTAGHKVHQWNSLFRSRIASTKQGTLYHPDKPA
jgi:hypothetical protein